MLRSRKSIRSKSRRAAIPLICLGLTGYFGYHVFHGDHGLVGWQRLSAEKSDAQIRLTILKSEEAELESRVSLLRSETLDPDMLDERARALLNYSGENEVVLFEQ
ncbi:MAG: septum formation initiator family protein [Pseudomonadota bacterium]